MPITMSVMFRSRTTLTMAFEIDVYKRQVRVASESVHVAEGGRNAARRHRDGHLMQRLGQQRPEVPVAVRDVYKRQGDDVPEEVKSRRLSEIIALQNELGHASNLRDVGREFEVLVEGESKRDRNQLSGRTSQNKVVVFDRGDHRVGDYVRVRITGCTPATLFGDVISGPCN